MLARFVGPNIRRGATAVFVTIMLPVLIGFAALTIDVAVLQNTRADLQNSADAAALAGAAALASQTMMQLRMNSGDSHALASVENDVLTQINGVASLNNSLAARHTFIEPDDVAIGWIDLESGTSPLQTGASPSLYNAVHVIVRRTAESRNGPVQLFFSPLFGKYFSNVTASAVAAYDDRFSGYDVSAADGPTVLPLTVDIIDYDRQVASGQDVFSYDPWTETVTREPDGVREVRAYPDRLAPGNYGLLNIGIPNLGIPEIAQQIAYGVPAADFELETGSAEITYYDDEGNPITHDITGNPGLKASLEVALNTRLGEIVVYFVHDAVRQSGSNTVYRTIGLRFGRIVRVALRQSGTSRGLWIQPVSYNGPGVVTDPSAPPSGGTAGRLMLVR